MKRFLAIVIVLGSIGLLAQAAHAQCCCPTTTTYYAPAATTTYYAPTVAYYPTTAYYAPTVSYYPTTAYYAPGYVGRPGLFGWRWRRAYRWANPVTIQPY